MKNCAKWITAAFTLSLLAGCSDGHWRAQGDDTGGATGTPVVSTGAGETRRYALADFTGVEVAGLDNVTIARGSSFSVTATGTDDALESLVLRVRDGTLEVRRRNGVSWSQGDPAEIRVTMPTLESASMAGSGALRSDTLTGANASVSIAGSGDVVIAGIAARDLSVAIAGSGSFTGTGTAQNADISIAGSGDVTAAGLQSTTADVSIAGSGDVAVRATGTADVSIIGSGDVTITGGATCTTSKIGSGDVTCG